MRMCDACLRAYPTIIRHNRFPFSPTLLLCITSTSYNHNNKKIIYSIRTDKLNIADNLSDKPSVALRQKLSYTLLCSSQLTPHDHTLNLRTACERSLL